VFRGFSGGREVYKKAFENLLCIRVTGFDFKKYVKDRYIEPELIKSLEDLNSSIEKKKVTKKVKWHGFIETYLANCCPEKYFS
jgi:hypothetical protein